MFCPELDQELEAIAELSLSLQAEFLKEVNAIEEWLMDCQKSGLKSTEPLFPKTPTAAQRSRKRPRVATILEDEEVADWTVKSSSPSPATRVRGSRAASKKANSMMKELSLHKKLRRPSGFDEKLRHTRQDEPAAVPSKRQRRQQDSVASTSGASFRSAHSTILDEDEPSVAATKAGKKSSRSAVDTRALDEAEGDEEPLITLKAEKTSTRSSKPVANEGALVLLAAAKATKPTKKSSKSAVGNQQSTSVADECLLDDSQDDEYPLVTLKATKTTKKSSKSAVGNQPSTSAANKCPFDDSQDDYEPLITLKATKPTKKSSKSADDNFDDSQDDDEPLVTLKATKPTKKSSKTAAGNQPFTSIAVYETDDDDAPLVEMRDSSRPPPSRVTRSVTTTAVTTTTTTMTTVVESVLVPPRHADPVVRLVSLSPADVERMSRPPRPDPVSVKKRVAAYEKEVLLKPAAAAAEPPVGRMTRTKTRAMVTAAGGDGGHNASQVRRSRAGPTQKAEMSLLQKLARKSINKALRISREKDRRAHEADKENSFVGQQAPKPAAAVPLTAAKVRNTPFSNSKPTRMVLTSASANRMVVNQSASHSTLVQEKSSSNILTGLDSLLGSKPKVASLEEVEEKKREELRRKKEKEEEAQRKKKEMMDRKIEQQRRKREEKMQKVLASREAQEREKTEREMRAEREKEEKARQVQEREERLREEMHRKRQQAMQKAVEIEERRRLEETQRLARIRELEEEQRRLAAQKKREAEEVERQNAKRQQEEAALAEAERQRAAAEARERQRAAAEAKEKERQRQLLKKKQQEKKKADPGLDGTFVVPSASTQAAAANTTTTIERPPLKPASEWDYEVADVSMADSESEDERNGQVPVWAGHSNLKERLNRLAYVQLNSHSKYFGSHPTTPNLVEVFGNPKLRAHKRTSSAVWKTMPRYSMMPSPK